MLFDEFFETYHPVLPLSQKVMEEPNFRPQVKTPKLHVKQPKVVWKPTRNQIKERQRKERWQQWKISLMTQQNGKCYYCEKPFMSQFIATFDHKTPKSRGGRNNEQNLCLACDKCNQLKGNKPENEFWAWKNQGAGI